MMVYENMKKNTLLFLKISFITLFLSANLNAKEPDAGYNLNIFSKDLSPSTAEKKPQETKNTQDTNETNVKIELIDAVLQAVSISYKIKASREKMIQAKHNIDIAYGSYLPSLDATYTKIRTQERPGNLTPEQVYASSKYFDDEKYALTLSQNIYAGGETQNDIQRLKALYSVARTDFERLLEDEITKAITSYIDVVFTKDSVEANKKNMEALETIFEIVNAKYEAGALSIGELSSIEASVSNAKSQLSKTNSKYNNALEYYKFITGELFKNTTPYEKIVHVDVTPLESVLESIPEKNSAIKSYNYSILSKKFNLKKNEAAFKPKVDLVLAAEKVSDQENFEKVEDSYIAKILVSYNIFNGNKDKNTYLKNFSSIQEVTFEKEAEMQKIKWELEKLYTSITSLQENLSNVENEVDSSRKMVSSYWESFRNGEQDLHVLLQGQRQLNAAELALVQSQQDTMKDYFSILKHSGGLLAYFKIDTNEANFIDMAKASYRAQYKPETKNSPLPKKAPISKDDINATEIAKIAHTPKESEKELTQLLSFHEKFLIESPDKFTIVLDGFATPLEALEKISELNISKESFIYEHFEDKKIKTKIAFGIFDLSEDANTSLKKKLSNEPQNRVEISNVKEVQDEFKEFSTLFFIDANNIPKVILPPKVEKVPEAPFETDLAFKDRFVNAPKDFFTINITTTSSIDSAAKLVKEEDIALESFVFKFGKNGEWYKLMYGIYPTYEEAKTALESLKKLGTAYLPVIEKISQKQELYKRFNEK